jgi:hypothetical protein
MNTRLKHELLRKTPEAYPTAIFKTGLATAFACLSKLAIVVAVMGLLASPVSAQTVRYYSATTSPTSVAAGTDNLHSFTIENCNGSAACDGAITTSPQSIRSTTVAIPAGFIVDPISCSVSAALGDIWNITFNLGVIEIVKQGSTELAPGESLTLSCITTAPCEAGFYEWTTLAYNDDDFTTPYTLQGTQPEVEVTGSCDSGGFEPGDFCSYTQGGWSSPPSGGNPGSILADNFDGIYADLIVGTGFAMTFESAPDVEAYLPAGGTSGALTANVTNPTSTSAGVFGGQVTALRLNVDFNDAGIIDGFLGSISGLFLQGTGGSLDGQTVAAILAAAELALGGGALPTGYDLSSLNNLVDELNNAFDNCDPSDWAQIHLTL